MRHILFLTVLLTITSCDAQLRLNHIQLKGTHNSYHLSTPPSLPRWDYTLPSFSQQVSSYNIRAFELDVHIDDEQIMIYHLKTYDQGTNCATLTSCLTPIVDWARPQWTQPDAPIIFIQMEVKTVPIGENKFDFTSQQWDTIDANLLSILPRERFITPTDVRGSYPTLRDAVLSGHGWPTLESSYGKFIIGLDGEYTNYYMGKNINLTNRIAFPTFTDTTNPLAAIIKYNNPLMDGAKIRSAVASNFIVRTRADVDLLNLPIPVTYHDIVNRLFKRMDLDNNSYVDKDELVTFITTLEPRVLPSFIENAYDKCNDTINGLTIENYKCVESFTIQLNPGITLVGRFDPNGVYMAMGHTIFEANATVTAAINSGAHIISTDYPGGAYTFKGLGSAANLTHAFTLPYPYMCNPVSTINMTCTNVAVNGIPSSSSSSSSTGTSISKNIAIIHVISVWNIFIVMIVAFIMM